MSWPTTLDRERLTLASKKIGPADAERQMRTAEELLRRLTTQPGVVLADEVGMGKTFVALAAALSAVWADKGKRPVVVMVPTSVQRKWVRDFEVFRELCLRKPEDRAIRVAEAYNALDFFKLLDDPPARRARIIFLSHGSFHRTLQDPWVKLAILKFAMHHAKLGDRRKALTRFAADILRTKGSHSSPEMFQRLLDKDFDHWREILAEYGDDPGDDPVPEALAKALVKSDLDLTELRQSLADVPLRDSKNVDDRLKEVRRALNSSFQNVWHEALVHARFRSPLLILDEAHHVKNPATKLASLFVHEDGDNDARLLSGALEGGFERMLFLTATPFQLGHAELLNVIDRFQGIDWKSLSGDGLAQFASQREVLSNALDEAQRAAVELDWQWGKLRRSDLLETTDEDLDQWWAAVIAQPALQPERVQQVIRAYQRTFEALRAAETCLRPWVLRHLRDRLLPMSTVLRRQRLPGIGIRSGTSSDTTGLPIADSALLPFLLASRAQAVVAHMAREQRDQRVYRATFAEGLSSSYETFLETRNHDADDIDEAATTAPNAQDPRLTRYLDRLRESLPDEATFAEHPKIAAVVKRVADLWEAGEKVVVFCHYRVTGRALVKHISSALEQRLWSSASKRMGITIDDAKERARHWGEAFEPDRPLDRTIRTVVEDLLAPNRAIGAEERERIADIVRRFVRTPLFLARYVDLTVEDRASALDEALLFGGTESLRGRLATFATFLTELSNSERGKYLEALGRIHPGLQYEHPEEGELQRGTTQLLPNVRLASGAVRPEVRERLLLGFNTPFFPEVLVASSVMAEGVDLHLNCRHIIHHDLDWNPSVLEQRTGRIDRINSKSEKLGRSIEVALPFVGGTQDEKMYRVVMDRERWFHIVMGEDFKTDEFATEVLAERVPLPPIVAKELSLRLDASGR